MGGAGEDVIEDLEVTRVSVVACMYIDGMACFLWKQGTNHVQDLSGENRRGHLS